MDREYNQNRNFSFNTKEDVTSRHIDDLVGSGWFIDPLGDDPIYVLSELMGKRELADSILNIPNPTRDYVNLGRILFDVDIPLVVYPHPYRWYAEAFMQEPIHIQGPSIPLRNTDPDLRYEELEALMADFPEQFRVYANGSNETMVHTLEARSVFHATTYLVQGMYAHSLLIHEEVNTITNDLRDENPLSDMFMMMIGEMMAYDLLLQNAGCTREYREGEMRTFAPYTAKYFINEFSEGVNDHHILHIANTSVNAILGSYYGGGSRNDRFGGERLLRGISGLLPSHVISRFSELYNLESPMDYLYGDGSSDEGSFS